MADKTLEEVKATPGKADDFFHAFGCYLRALADAADATGEKVVNELNGKVLDIPIGQINTWGPILADFVERADKATNQCSGTDPLKTPKNPIAAAILSFLSINLSKYGG